MIILFGPQGSGKGTQAEILATRSHWRSLSTGQIFRDSKNPEIHRRLETGELIDDQLTNEMLYDALAAINTKTEVILDGYPRNIAQAHWLLSNMSKLDRKVDCIIEIDVPRQESVKRMLARGRADDTVKAIERRLKIYQTETAPIIDLYRSRNIPYARVDGIGTVEEVQARIQDAVEACVRK